MKIKINEQYCLRSTRYQYMISKIVGINKDGEPVYSDIGYYHSIKRALEAFGEYQILTSDITTLEELGTAIYEIKTVLDEINAKLTLEAEK